MEKLKKQLDENIQWPSEYMYKFIIENDDEKLQQIKSIFQRVESFESKLSKTEKYISITVIANCKNSDQVIEKYKKLEKIEGIISL